MLVDTHCHVHFNAFHDDVAEVIARTRARGVVMNAVGTHKDTSLKAIQCAETYEGIVASVGLHPVHLFSQHLDEEESSFQTREEVFDEEYYRKLAEHPKVVGIGECGFDVFRMPEGKTRAEVLARQREVFAGHIRVAKAVQKPLVIHVRDAYEEMLETLTLEAPLQNAVRGVLHCYLGTWVLAQEFLKLGFYLGVTGICTFPPKKTNPQAQEELLKTIRLAPLSRLVLETDSPYLAPNPYRGKRSEPWMVEEVAKKIAELKEISVEEVHKVTTANARELFNLPY